MRIGPMELVVITFMTLLYLWPIWRICRKAGFPGALSLLAIIPAANIGLLLFLAFAEWPVLRNTKPIATDRDF